MEILGLYIKMKDFVCI